MNIKVIVIAGLAILLLGGAYVFTQNKSGNPLSPSGGFTSIQDALSKSISLECNFTDETGRETTSYIKNGAVRADFTGETDSEAGSMIFKDNISYVWTADGTALMMQVPDEVKSDESIIEKGGEMAGDFQSTLGELEKYKDSCKPAVVSDSLFVPPADVEFVDFSEFLDIPVNPDENPALSEEQLKKLQEQFGGQQ